MKNLCKSGCNVFGFLLLFVTCFFASSAQAVTVKDVQSLQFEGIELNGTYDEASRHFLGRGYKQTQEGKHHIQNKTIFAIYEKKHLEGDTEAGKHNVYIGLLEGVIKEISYMYISLKAQNSGMKQDGNWSYIPFVETEIKRATNLFCDSDNVGSKKPYCKSPPEFPYPAVRFQSHPSLTDETGRHYFVKFSAMPYTFSWKVKVSAD